MKPADFERDISGDFAGAGADCFFGNENLDVFGDDEVISIGESTVTFEGVGDVDGGGEGGGDVEMDKLEAGRREVGEIVRALDGVIVGDFEFHVAGGTGFVVLRGTG